MPPPPKDDDFVRAVNAAFQKDYARWLRVARKTLARRAARKSDQEAEDLVNAAYQAIRDRRNHNPEHTIEQFIFNTIDSLAKDAPRSAWIRKKVTPRAPTEDEENPPPSDRNATTQANAEELVAQKEEQEHYDGALVAAVTHFGEDSIEAKYIAAIREGITDPDELAEKLGVPRAELDRIADRVDYRIEKILEEKEKQQRLTALKVVGKKKS